MSWKDRLQGFVTEEQQDKEKYLMLAEEAEKEGCCHEAGVLRDIAQDEHTHHKLISEMIS